MKSLVAALSVFAAARLLTADAAAQISLVGITYNQNFDGMTANIPGSSTTPTGWFVGAVGTGTNGAVGATSVTNSTGTVSTGTNYNFGVAGVNPDTDRALGSIASGTGNRVTEVRLANNTGLTITNLNVIYDGEQWRDGGAGPGTNNTLTMFFSTDGTNFTAMGPSFTLASPQDGSTAAVLDGNAAANRVAGIGGNFATNVADGVTFYLRWLDLNSPGADDGLAVDNFALTVASDSSGASTINPTNNFAYGANIGWMDWRGDSGTNGVVIREFVCSGNIYAANTGWINLGNDNPTNGIQYQNNSGSDFGVNNLGTGELRGFAYGANIGWIVFTNHHASGVLLTTDVPRFNLVTGRFSGYAYSANCGWISLSNAFASVQTDRCIPGADLDGDGITDAWERQFGGTNLFTAAGDSDGDGVNDIDEYRADTSPSDVADNLRITAYTANSAGSTSTVTWTSKQTRLYQVQSRTDLVTGSWSTNSPPGLVVPDIGATTTRGATGVAATNRFFRVQSIQPLKP